MPAGKLVKLFYSYAHDDESLRDELQKHLSTLKREGVISEWHDRSIRAGQEWDPEIQRELAAADIVLVLLSADFTASQYCAKEVEFALHLHRRGSTRVIPVLLRPVDWSGPLQGLQALPKNSLPVTSWLNRDEAFLDIAQGIRRAAADLQEGQFRLVPAGTLSPRAIRLQAIRHDLGSRTQQSYRL